MLEFIELYNKHLLEGKTLPESTRKLNQLLYSVKYKNCSALEKTPYSIKKAKGQYIVINAENNVFFEYNQEITKKFNTIEQACEYIYKSIADNTPELLEIDFQAKANFLNKFPNKQHKVIRQVLNVLFETETEFDINCDIKLCHEVSDLYFCCSLQEVHDEPYTEEDALFYIIHDGSNIYELLSYDSAFFNHGYSWLAKYLGVYFEVESYNAWATGLKPLNDNIWK